MILSVSGNNSIFNILNILTFQKPRVLFKICICLEVISGKWGFRILFGISAYIFSLSYFYNIILYYDENCFYSYSCTINYGDIYFLFYQNILYILPT